MKFEPPPWMLLDREAGSWATLSSTLAALKRLLESRQYWRLAPLPWFESRRRYPWRDLWVERRSLSSRPLALASHASPSRLCRGLPPSLLELRDFFWMQGLHQHGQPWLSLGDLVEECDQAVRARLHVAVLAGPPGLPPRYLFSSIPGRTPGPFVYLGDDSGLLLDAAGEAQGERLLDLCCGGGALALALGARFSQVVGCDLNPQAIALAQLSRQLNDLPENWDFRVSDLFDNVSGDFDWIVGNPPALPLIGKETLFAYGGGASTDLTLRIVEQLPERLRPGGQALLLTFSPAAQLWEQLEDCWPGELSLDYRVRARFHLASPDCPVLDHVFLHIRRDGRGQRRLHQRRWWERLHQWSWGAGESGPPRLP